MTPEELEKLTDEMAERAKSGRDLSKWLHEFSGLAQILTHLTGFRKSSFPQPNFMTIKDKVLDRISIPENVKNSASGWFVSVPSLLRILAGGVGTLLILISLSIGTAVVALQSSPGESIYPLKTVVENIELTLTRDSNKRADLQIQFANNRLEELSEVIAKNRAGEISSDEAEKIVAQTVTALQKTTEAASKNTKSAPKVSTLNKLVDLSNKQAAVLQPLLSAASVTDEGEVKIALEQALETSTQTKQEAVQNIENAGISSEQNPAETAPETSPTETQAPPNNVKATGKITSNTRNSINIGTSRFYLTNDTKYVNIVSTDIQEEVTVEIVGEVRDDGKTYAVTITGIDPTPTQNTPNTNQDSNTETDK